jgi:aspartyl aminopeptidase
MRARRRSFLISADMAHALHPSYPDRHDSSHAPVMGGGPVLKSHGLKNYATDVHSEARIMNTAGKAGIRMQKLIVRPDLPCGSTIGPAASSGTSIRTVDIGSPQWAMHSARETASLRDIEAVAELLREYWKS